MHSSVSMKDLLNKFTLHEIIHLFAYTDKCFPESLHYEAVKAHFSKLFAKIYSVNVGVTVSSKPKKEVQTHNILPSKRHYSHLDIPTIAGPSWLSGKAHG